jgi:hypothetical protein
VACGFHIQALLGVHNSELGSWQDKNSLDKEINVV